MEVMNRIGFRTDVSVELVRYLDDNGLKYEVSDKLAVAIIGSDSPHWPFISKFVEREHLFCLKHTEFTDAELREAAWLSIRSEWRVGYPQPEEAYGYESITYSKMNCCPVCGTGLEQVKPFQIKKIPRWSRRHFAELNWVGDELFVDSAAKDALEGAVTGVSFWPVKNKRGTETLSNIYQLYIPYILQEGLNVQAQSVRRSTKCKRCGRIKHLLSGEGELEFKKEIFDGVPDVVKTFESFGDGKYSAKRILVRAKVFQAIMSKGLGKHLVFEPVKLIHGTGNKGKDRLSAPEERCGAERTVPNKE